LFFTRFIWGISCSYGMDLVSRIICTTYCICSQLQRCKRYEKRNCNGILLGICNCLVVGNNGSFPQRHQRLVIISLYTYQFFNLFLQLSYYLRLLSLTFIHNNKMPNLKFNMILLVVINNRRIPNY
jgi:hypothetical protein